jgi:hypothetical protein
MKESQFQLGRIAHQLESKYGDKTLERFAGDIGIDDGTLKSYRTTYKAWKDLPVRPKSYSVARVLNRHPDRAEIIQDNPDITVKEAEEKVREWKAQHRVSEKGKTRQLPDQVQVVTHFAPEIWSEMAIVSELNDFLSNHSEITEMILEHYDQSQAKLSYMEDIVEALEKLSFRITTIIEGMFPKATVHQLEDEAETV